MSFFQGFYNTNTIQVLITIPGPIPQWNYYCLIFLYCFVIFDRSTRFTLNSLLIKQVVC